MGKQKPPFIPEPLYMRPQRQAGSRGRNSTANRDIKSPICNAPSESSWEGKTDQGQVASTSGLPLCPQIHFKSLRKG